MTTNNISDVFVKASREKTRFPYRGMCAVEDLWDLPVGELDEIFKSLNAKLRIDKEESLLDQNDNVSSVLDTQVAIIRHIVGTKIDEANVANQEVVRTQKKHRILSILANKQDESLVAMSEDDLAKMLEDL
jgi:hypothetical protein